MNSPFSDELAQVRTLLPTLTPSVDATIPFTALAGDLSAAEEPATRTRAFEVAADGSTGITSGMLAPHSRQARRRFTVTILYDSQHDNPALDSTVAADDDLLIANIEQPPYPAGVQFVVCAGARVVKSGDFLRRSIDFDCLYVHSF